MSAWEDFEQSFIHLFITLLKIQTESLPAKRAYGSIRTFKGRQEMVETAGEAYFFEHPAAPMKSRFKPLLLAAIGYGARRNEIAHGIVSKVWIPGGIISGPAGQMMQLSESWGYGVVPSEYATSKTRPTERKTLLSDVGAEPVYTYTARDIQVFTAGFATIKAQTIDLEYNIRAWTQNVVLDGSSHRRVPRKSLP